MHLYERNHELERMAESTREATLQVQLSSRRGRCGVTTTLTSPTSTHTQSGAKLAAVSCLPMILPQKKKGRGVK